MNRRARTYLGAVVGLLAATALIALGASTVGAKPSKKGKADRGTVYIAVTPRPSPSLLYAAGDGVDKVLGEGAITFTIKPLPTNVAGTITVKAVKVTIWGADGSLSGTGSATVTITNKPKQGDATVSNGKASFAKGTGGQKGHSLKITFTGKGSVSSGSYIFNYKGTYK
jgi:hypothetical protein